MNENNEEKPKSLKGFTILFALFAIVEIGLLVTGFVIMFSEIFAPGFDMDFNRFYSSFYYIGGFMVGLMIFFPILMVTFISSKRKALTKTFHNIPTSMHSSAAAMAPYTASYMPSKKGDTFYCDYCGYEVRSGERECPKCSGPIKRGKRVA